MHRIVQAVLLLLVASCAPLPASGGGGGWRSLFDERTLRGWTPKIAGHALGEDPHGTFQVKDGAIRVSYDRYDRFAGRFGHLAYRTPFQAYRIRLEYRFSGSWLCDVQAWQQSNRLRGRHRRHLPHHLPRQEREGARGGAIGPGRSCERSFVASLLAMTALG